LILYRGPWPGPYPQGGLAGAQGNGASSGRFTASLARWAAWQVAVANKAGLSQAKGLGFWFVEDLPQRRKSMDLDEGDLHVDGASRAPLPEPLAKGSQLALMDTSQLDVLPPVPGESKILGEDGQPLYQAASTQIEWKAFEDAYKNIPLGSWLDFMEVTFDTEDWHRVADKFSEVAGKSMEVLLLWRHDWRASSRYERIKRLEVAGIAGLSGPWPDDGWPSSEGRIFPQLELGSASSKNQALAFEELSISRGQGQWQLTCRTNRPAVVRASWGRELPLQHRAAQMDKALVHRLELKGAKQGDKLLLTVRAESDRWGRAVARTRWIQVADTAKPIGTP
jgi:hypothetical protein